MEREFPIEERRQRARILANLAVGVADIESVAQVDREYLVPISAKVELELAEKLMRLADDGDRTLSREIRRALLEYIAKPSQAGGKVLQ
jgi:hypothetical protein